MNEQKKAPAPLAPVSNGNTQRITSFLAVSPALHNRVAPSVSKSVPPGTIQKESKINEFG
jgi:hypothetical protein